MTFSTYYFCLGVKTYKLQTIVDKESQGYMISTSSYCATKYGLRTLKTVDVINSDSTKGLFI